MPLPLPADVFSWFHYSTAVFQEKIQPGGGLNSLVIERLVKGMNLYADGVLCLPPLHSAISITLRMMMQISCLLPV